MRGGIGQIGGTGHPHVYSFKLNPKDIDEKISPTSTIYETEEDISLKMQKEAESFLSCLPLSGVEKEALEKILATIAIPQTSKMKELFKADSDSEHEKEQNLFTISKTKEDKKIFRDAWRVRESSVTLKVSMPARLVTPMRGINFILSTPYSLLDNSFALPSGRAC